MNNPQVRWFPRTLSEMEMKDVRVSGGKTMEAVVGGSATLQGEVANSNSGVTSTEIEQWMIEKDRQDAEDLEMMNKNSDWGVRRLSGFVKSELAQVGEKMGRVEAEVGKLVGVRSGRRLGEQTNGLHEDGRAEVDGGALVFGKGGVLAASAEDSAAEVDSGWRGPEDTLVTKRSVPARVYEPGGPSTSEEPKIRFPSEGKSFSPPAPRSLQSAQISTICHNSPDCWTSTQRFVQKIILDVLSNSSLVKDEGRFCNSYLEELTDSQGIFRDVTVANCTVLVNQFFLNATNCFELPGKAVPSASPAPIPVESSKNWALQRWASFRQRIVPDADTFLPNPFFDVLRTCAPSDLVGLAQLQYSSAGSPTVLEKLGLRPPLSLQNDSNWTTMILPIVFDKLATAYYTAWSADLCSGAADPVSLQAIFSGIDSPTAQFAQHLRRRDGVLSFNAGIA